MLQEVIPQWLPDRLRLLQSSQVALDPLNPRDLPRQPSFQAVADFLMRQHFTSLHLSQALFDFADKPLIVVGQPLYGFPYQGVCVAALRRGKTCKLGLQVGFRSTSIPLSVRDGTLVSRTHSRAG